MNTAEEQHTDQIPTLPGLFGRYIRGVHRSRCSVPGLYAAGRIGPVPCSWALVWWRRGGC